MKQCNTCGASLIPYNENISWEIKWNSRDGLFTLFIYLKEGTNRIKIYYELIPNSIIFSLIGKPLEINKFVENSIKKILKD